MLITLVELRRLARHCDYWTNLDDSLRDRFVCGLRNTATIKKLLAEKSLTFNAAVQTATAMETASKDATELGKTSASPSAVHHLDGPKSSDGKAKTQASSPSHKTASTAEKCYRCGRRGHKPADCRCIDMECHKCGRKGHISRACTQRPGAKNSTQKSKGIRNAKQTHALEEEDSDYEYGLNSVKDSSPAPRHRTRVEPIWIDIKINGITIRMELDTGSALTILPTHVYNEHFKTPLQPTSTVLKPYSGARLHPKGVFHAQAVYADQYFDGDVYVVDTDGPPLFGREWLQQIRFDWKSLHSIRSTSTSQLISPDTQKRLD